METDKKVENEQDNTLAHVTNQGKEKDTESYDPDRYVPSATSGEEHEEGVPLEEAEPDEGYSTDPAQGKWSASLHLADEDMDRRLDDPLKEAKNIQESYEKSEQHSRQEKL
ncbi:hypothetical protein [Salmonirosea aquatica]|uniref:Uncharacterized protein n=1 Tax=Salmonirosea aquatica TaxID=2654236 RepID=A0A7C9FZ38_9BACT|nr:hypothetical protein [Cytophagaceae bacterium SJW1-29]